MTEIRDFNQLKIILPLICMLATITVVYLTGEHRIDLVNRTADEIRSREERLRELSVLTGDVVTAESAHRGYLLTQDTGYLAPFKSAKQGARSMLQALKRNGGATDDNVVQELDELGVAMEAKFTEMDHILALTPKAHQTSLQLMRSDSVQENMRHIEHLESTLVGQERDHLVVSLRKFTVLNQMTQLTVALEFGVMIALLLIAAKLLWRDMDRRTTQAAVLEDKVQQRTAELRALAAHSHRAVEEVRQNLARELHDELGGILVGIKIDLSQLEKRIDIAGQPQVAKRWDNIQEALSQAIELKRRVIEELHPSLLDTMGLAAASRWQTEQFCERLGLRLNIEVQEPVPPLSPHEAIQVFRILQECLTNVGKHARATALQVLLASSSGEVVLEIADNGVGLPPDSENRPQSHGLRGMRSRAEGINGTVSWQNTRPGTRTVVRIPHSA